MNAFTKLAILILLCAAGPAAAASAVLQDFSVDGMSVILKLNQPVSFRAARKDSPPAVIVTLEDTDVSQEARDKSTASIIVAGIEALPAVHEGKPSARVVIKLDKARDFSPEWAGSDLILKFKDAAAASAKPAAPAASKAPPAAPAGTWRIRGKVSGKDGKPVSGEVAAAFRLKDESSADVWSEWVKLEAAGGDFWAVLGKTNPLPESFEGTKLVAETDAGTITMVPFRIQVASFPEEETAKKMKAELEPKLGALHLKPATVSGKKYFRLYLGPIPDRASAQQALDKAKALGHQGILQHD